MGSTSAQLLPVAKVPPAWKAMSGPGAARIVLRLLCLYAVLLTAVVLEQRLARGPFLIAPIWPSAALAVWAIRRWRVVARAAIVLTAATYTFAVLLEPTGGWAGITAVPAAACVGFGAAICFSISEQLLRSLPDGALLDNVSTAIGRLVPSAIAGSGAYATLAACAFLGTGNLAASDIAAFWLVWTAANAAAIIVYYPFLDAWSHPGADVLFTPQRCAVALPLLSILAFLSAAAGTEHLADGWRLAGILMIGPFLFVLAYGSGVRFGTAGAAVVTTAALVAGVDTGGPLGTLAGEFGALPFQLVASAAGLTVLAVLGLVNERRAAERQVMRLSFDMTHSSRAGVTGEMAAGIAHEFHQPLAAIVNYANSCLIRTRRGAAESLEEPLEKIVGEAMRAGEVLRDIRGRLSRSDRDLASRNVNEIVEHSLNAWHRADPDAAGLVSVALDPIAPLARVDAREVQHVLYNVLLNAMQAGEGLERTRRMIDVRSWLTHDEVVIEVADRGRGMDADVLGQACERFFSTRADGLGMGLAVSRTLAERQGGRLELDSRRGVGTRVRLVLPLSDAGRRDAGLSNA